MASCNSCVQPPFVCPDKFGCPPGQCPDFEIKRHDTQPPINVSVDDCDGPIDLTDVVVEVSMWAKAKLKCAIQPTDTYFGVADGIGFEQSLVGDIIIMDRVRGPEQMLIIGHDENNKLIQVQRGYHGTTPGTYRKGTPFRIFRVLKAFGETIMDREDQTDLDGTVTPNVLIESRVAYNWQPNDTCVPGCYWLEFTLLKMNVASLWLGDTVVTPSFTTVTPSQAGCYLGAGVEWVRRVPVTGEGFLIKIDDSPTAENVTP